MIVLTFGEFLDDKNNLKRGALLFGIHVLLPSKVFTADKFSIADSKF